MGAYMCQNISNCTLLLCAIYCVSIHLNKAVMKKKNKSTLGDVPQFAMIPFPSPHRKKHFLTWLIAGFKQLNEAS